MTAGSELQFVRKMGRHAWRMAWVLVAIQVVVTAVGIASLRFLPKKYVSSTTIRVERGQMINPLTRGLAVASETEDHLRTIREEILSRDYFERVVAQLALAPRGATPLQRQQFVERMIRNTQITTAQREADTFQIAYTGRDPKEVHDVTNVLAGIFIEESLSNKAGEAGAALEFLRSQLEIYRRKLEDSEGALRSYEEQHVDQLPSNRAAQLSRLEQLRATLVEVENNLRQEKLQRDLLRSQLAPEKAEATEDAPGRVMMPNPLQARLREKQAELRGLLLDYSESYPDVVTLRAEIAALEKEIKANPTVPAGEMPSRVPSSVQDALGIGQLQQLEVQVRAMTTREQQLQQEIARFEKKVQGIPEVEQELTRLRRDYDVNNEIYNSFLRRMEEARVSKELEASKRGEVFRILQAASLPLVPVSPKPIQVVLLAVAAGAGLGTILVYLLAQGDTSFQSASEVQGFLGLRVVAGLPRHVSSHQRTHDRLKAALLAVVAGSYLAAVAAFLLWARISPLLRGGK